MLKSHFCSQPPDRVSLSRTFLLPFIASPQVIQSCILCKIPFYFPDTPDNKQRGKYSNFKTMLEDEGWERKGRARKGEMRKCIIWP